MAQHWSEHHHSVSGAATGSRQIDDQGATRHPGNATAQHGSRHIMIIAVPRDSCSKLWNFPFDHLASLLRRLIAGMQPGATRRDHDSVASGHGVS
jgi:hypothetical protein